MSKGWSLGNICLLGIILAGTSGWIGVTFHTEFNWLNTFFEPFLRSRFGSQLGSEHNCWNTSSKQEALER
eukprot:5604801-Amphidinium_carterae.1